MKDKLSLSVSIISFNEEANIARTLERVCDIAEEIVVVDSFSNDRTKEIAENYGALVYQENWKGHIKQKNSAIEKCSKEWILSIDCDEVINDELKKSIVNHIKNNKSSCGIINRKTFYLGKILNYAWQPDLKVRLVKKEYKPYWTGLDPHDELRIEQHQYDSEKLSGYLTHYSFKDIEDHYLRIIKYAKISANSYLKNNKSSSFLKLVLNPAGSFIKQFILKRAFLDGYRGFLVAISSFFYNFLKYVFILESKFKK